MECRRHAISSGTELQASYRCPSSGHQDGPAQSTKRRFDATTELDPLPTKRSRVTRDAQRPEVEHKQPEPTSQTALQQPNPKHPKRPNPSFLRGFVGPVSLNRPESVHSLVSEWLESVGSDREERCRSDSYLLQPSSDGPISNYLTRSAPEMDRTRDTDEVGMPGTPISNGPHSHPAPTGSVVSLDYTSATLSSNQLSSRSLVEDPLYRSVNLVANNIYLRNPDDEFPEHIAALLDRVRRDRESPGPSPDQLRHSADLHELENGAGQPEVEEYFRSEIVPKVGVSGNLKRTDRQPMAKHTVPNSESKLKVSTPVPDMLYGYNRHNAFPQQGTQLISMGNTLVANNQDLLLPFLVIEFKGDGGSMWVATNQCLGAAASSVNIAERLNRQLKKYTSAKLLDSSVFSIATNGTETRLYISWKHSELIYFMQKVDSFLVQKPGDYLEFRKYVRNIFDWGNYERLDEIRKSLDSLLEQSIKISSAAAKSRNPPSDSSVASRRKRQTPSLRRTSGESSSMTGQGWEHRATTEQSERWLWTNGKFQYYKGNDLVKEQVDTPADVWIHCDKGWPGQEGKKWRMWISATRELLYS